MLLRILVNIGDYVPKLTIIGDGHSSERMLKQTSSAVIGNVDALGIGVEEVGETLACVINGDRP
jgi:hypothetical protein